MYVNIRSVKPDSETYGSLDLAKKISKRFRCVGAGGEFFDSSCDILVQIDHVVRLVLKDRHNAGELANELNVSVITSIPSSDIPRRVELIDELVPANAHA